MDFLPIFPPHFCYLTHLFIREFVCSNPFQISILCPVISKHPTTVLNRNYTFFRHIYFHTVMILLLFHYIKYIFFNSFLVVVCCPYKWRCIKSHFAHINSISWDFLLVLFGFSVCGCTLSFQYFLCVLSSFISTKHIWRQFG